MRVSSGPKKLSRLSDFSFVSRLIPSGDSNSANSDYGSFCHTPSSPPNGNPEAANASDASKESNNSSTNCDSNGSPAPHQR